MYARVTVHFNLEDPHEEALYRHLRAQTVQSSYIKRLIFYDRLHLIDKIIMGGGIHGEQNQGVKG